MLNSFLKYIYSFSEPRIPESWENILNHNSHYFQSLEPRLKKRFLKRLYINYKVIEFMPVSFPTVSEEMKVLICSAIVQITFGLDEFTLNRFDRIYVMPSNYDYLNYKNLLGHVDFNAQIICLSWPSVKEGFIIPDDAMNVALHEVSHALMEENRFRVLGFRFFGHHKLREWEKEGLKKLNVIRAQRNVFLNSYGGQNMLEMFAVCVETFFEQPKAFHRNLPKLYMSMSRLLNQDPRSFQNPLTIPV